MVDPTMFLCTLINGATLYRLTPIPVDAAKNRNLRTAEKLRGWLEFGRFLDQIDRNDAN